MEVTSEILPYFEKDTQSKPILDEKNVISKFTFKIPDFNYQVKETQPEKDDDGDYMIERNSSQRCTKKVIKLEHSVSTELKCVGLQIWRAALLQADFIIYSQNTFAGKTVLELGAGVGLTSIVAGMFAKRVICTDLDTGNILKLMESNLKRNADVIQAQMSVRGLNFFDTEWFSDLEKELQEVTVVFAADVIYDNDVTEAFVRTITKILSVPPKKTLYIALEKRYVFTIADLDSVAPCYEHLISCLKIAQMSRPFSQWTVNEIPLDFPQFFNYERTKELVLYRVTT